MSSDDRVYRVLVGFSKLTYAEREDCVKKLNEFINADTMQKGLLTEQFEKRAFSLGPLDSGGCPCCGK